MTAANSRTTTTGEPLAQRLRHIAPFRVMEVIARARKLEDAGRSIVHMEVGEPDFPTAAPIVAAGQQALADGRTRYTESRGILPLRQAIADHYQTRYGVHVPVERIVVTPGASGALLLACAVLLNAGDEVLMAVLIPVGPEHAYQLSPLLVEQRWTKRTKAVMLASPSNPTGTVIDAAVQAEIVQQVVRRRGFAIVDEIYHGLTYDDAAETTALALDDGSEHTFVINSFSKYFGMTGWRLGWLVAPPKDQLKSPRSKKISEMKSRS